MVNVTGTVRLPCEVVVKAICPVYVPTASETSGFTVTVMTLGVVQQFVPEFAIVSHEPPVLVVAVALKVKFVPLLIAVMICGRGLAPPNGLVNARAGMGSKF